jgi:hypothetical protein
LDLLPPCYSTQAPQCHEDGPGFETELVGLANTKGIANTIRLDFVALIANDKVFDIFGAAALFVKSAVKAYKTAPTTF